MSRQKSNLLCDLIQSEETLIMPDAYDPLSARLIENSGFKAVQVSGYSISLAWGLSDESSLPVEWNLAVTKRIAKSVSAPVMADGEDGYGDSDITQETARAFIKAGCAGMNIEDQALHHKTGPDPIISFAAMEEKISAIVETGFKEGNPDFIINARTDALATNKDRQAGLEEAIKRANGYLRAGADMAFVVGVKTMEEVKAIVAEIEGPLSLATGLPYNREAMPIEALKALGIARISLPVLPLFIGGQAISEALHDVASKQKLTSKVNDFENTLKEMESH
ncbi:MAG: isocitrate lyase/PEP mutase family protein [Rhodospirillales bacterium]|nr:isocitrate lyase/PEP mutase family protein [Rhodospirillales bacterium]